MLALMRQFSSYTTKSKFLPALLKPHPRVPGLEAMPVRAPGWKFNPHAGLQAWAVIVILCRWLAHRNLIARRVWHQLVFITKRSPSLSLIKSSTRNKEGSDDPPELLNRAFSTKSTQCIPKKCHAWEA